MYVVGVPGARVMWLAAPPSDHDWKVYVWPLFAAVGRDVARQVLAAEMIAGRLDGDAVRAVLDAAGHRVRGPAGHAGGLRTCAGRWSVGAPSVAVGDEFADGEDGGGQAQRGVTVAGLAVGVAAQLAVVRPP